MMWLVRIALRRPLSVAVMALLMLVLGCLCFALMNVDIFPAINLPVVTVTQYPSRKFAGTVTRHPQALTGHAQRHDASGGTALKPESTDFIN